MFEKIGYDPSSGQSFRDWFDGIDSNEDGPKGPHTVTIGIIIEPDRLNDFLESFQEIPNAGSPTLVDRTDWPIEIKVVVESLLELQSWCTRHLKSRPGVRDYICFEYLTLNLKALGFVPGNWAPNIRR